MSLCTIFGGAGFIGTHLAQFLLTRGLASHVHIADTAVSPLQGHEGISTSKTDVRLPIPRDITSAPPSWIFNLAAVHREPGHRSDEYFDTNIVGAQNVCEYADKVAAPNLYFTSSISVYGPTTRATSEDALIRPISPYGGSKYPAEWVHRAWRGAAPSRRLIICRPGVIYGPGDPGNILRMIRAVKRGYFVFPGSPQIVKSYGYIYGLLDSIEFTMARNDGLIIYNYVESPTEPVGKLVEHVKEMLQTKAPVLSIPMPLLLPVARGLRFVLGDRTPIHPVRVRKAGMATHIVPGWLSAQGFAFRYSFKRSLEHWYSVSPRDFG